MTAITKETLTAKLREVVAGDPDYVYPDAREENWEYRTDFGECQYATPDGYPACIWGHVIARLDVSQLPVYDEAVGTGIGEVLQRFRINVNEDQAFVSACEAAQKTQDTGGTWAEALADFEDTLANGGHRWE